MKFTRHFKKIPMPPDMVSETMDAIIPAKTEDVQAAINKATEQHSESLQKLAEE